MTATDPKRSQAQAHSMGRGGYLGNELLMTTFGDFLARVRLREVKLGPFTWDIQATPASEVASKLESSRHTDVRDLIREGVSELDELIKRIDNFDSEASGVYYIGATLIRCDSYLEDNGIVGAPLELVQEIIYSIDDETSHFVGGVAPYVPLGKLNKLKRALKQIRAELDVQLAEELSQDA